MNFNSIMRNDVIPAAIGGAGAVVMDVVQGYINPYLPAALQSGWFNLIAKGTGAVLLGMVAARFLGRERARMVTIGALTVIAYGTLRQLAQGAGIPGLSGYADYTPYPMGAYIQGATGTPGIQGLGFVSPAAVVGPTMSPRMGAYMPGAMNVAPTLGDYGDGM